MKALITSISVNTSTTVGRLLGLSSKQDITRGLRHIKVLSTYC